jgi:hypothetical protein
MDDMTVCAQRRGGWLPLAGEKKYSYIYRGGQSDSLMRIHADGLRVSSMWGEPYRLGISSACICTVNIKLKSIKRNR